MAAATTSHTGHGWMAIDLVGVAAHTGGDIANVLNPEGEHLIITQAVLYSKTISTGAANLNAGIGTTLEHDQTELVNAVDVNALSAGTAVNGFANGDAADVLPIWGEDEYLVVNASATTVGFTGTLYVKYLHV